MPFPGPFLSLHTLPASSLLTLPEFRILWLVDMSLALVRKTVLHVCCSVYYHRFYFYFLYCFGVEHGDKEATWSKGFGVAVYLVWAINILDFTTLCGSSIDRTLVYIGTKHWLSLWNFPSAF